jgi:hypothetical protein
MTNDDNEKTLTAEEAIENLRKAAEAFDWLPEEEKEKERERYLMWQIGVTQSL